MNKSDGPALEVRGLFKSFTKAGKRIDVLKGLDLTLTGDEIVGILGASGAGKSTLLHLAGGLDRPTSGQVLYKGVDISLLDEQGLAVFRNRKVGFIFQMHYLLSEFNCLENVMMPGIVAGSPKNTVKEKAEAILHQVGLADRMQHRPGELSGGEQQRAAVARALVNDPSVVLADEPTGNLDSVTAGSVQDLFLELNLTHGTAFLVVTHNREMALKFNRRYTLSDGVLREET